MAPLLRRNSRLSRLLALAPCGVLAAAPLVLTSPAAGPPARRRPAAGPPPARWPPRRASARPSAPGRPLLGGARPYLAGPRDRGAVRRQGTEHHRLPPPDLRRLQRHAELFRPAGQLPAVQPGHQPGQRGVGAADRAAGGLHQPAAAGPRRQPARPAPAPSLSSALGGAAASRLSEGPRAGGVTVTAAADGVH